MSKSPKDERSLPNKEDVRPQTTTPMGSQVPPHGHDHEYRDISFRGIYQFLVVLAATIVGTMLVVWGFFAILESRAESTDAERPPMAEPTRVERTDTLQPTPRIDMARFRQMEDSVLASAGWADETKTSAKIPIDAAIAYIVANPDAIGASAAVVADSVANDAPAATDSTAAAADDPHAGHDHGQ